MLRTTPLAFVLRGDMADALATLHRLRRLATDQARRDLAAMVAIEHSAEARLAAARSALSSEAAAATTDAAHPLAGAYATWLPAAQAQRAVAATAVRAAQAEVALTRGLLADARAAARAVEIMTEARGDQARRERLRREQVAADDFGRRR